MTWSSRTRFEYGERRAVIVASDSATVYAWRADTLESALVFTADDAGVEEFARYIREAPPSPILVAVDVVEEEYRQDTVPHVRGADRRAVIERKQSRLFRGTRYCHALLQGREREGRRDDRVLLTALMKPELLDAWLAPIHAAKVPLAGVYSLPLLSRAMLPQLGATETNILLLTMHEAGGLRQTFFRDQQFKVSRLAPMPRLGTVPFAAYVLGELEKLRRYLNSLALTARDEPLHVYILAHGSYLDELENHCQDTEAEKFLLVDVGDVARRLKIPGTMTTPYSDALFAQLLLRKLPRNHYASREQTHYFVLHQARSALLAGSLAMLFGASLWGGMNFVEGISFKRQALEAANKTQFYRARYEAARADLPPTPVEPLEIKAAVDIVDTLRRFKSSPVPLLKTVSTALGRAPEIELDGVDWVASTDPNAATGSGVSAREPAPVPRDESYSHYEIAELRGHVNGFGGDYRAAIADVERFAGTLRELAAVHDVQITDLPIDIDSAGNLSTSDTLEPEARFGLRVVIGVKHGTG